MWVFPFGKNDCKRLIQFHFYRSFLLQWVPLYKETGQPIFGPDNVILTQN